MRLELQSFDLALIAILFSGVFAAAELTDAQAQLARDFGIAQANADRCSGVQTNSDLMVKLRKEAGVTRRQAMVGGEFNRALLARYGIEHGILWAIADEKTACAAGVAQFGPFGIRIRNLLIIDPGSIAAGLIN